jgi:hypothetical protein
VRVFAGIGLVSIPVRVFACFWFGFYFCEGVGFVSIPVMVFACFLICARAVGGLFPLEGVHILLFLAVRVHLGRACWCAGLT